MVSTAVPSENMTLTRGSPESAARAITKRSDGVNMHSFSGLTRHATTTSSNCLSASFTTASCPRVKGSKVPVTMPTVFFFTKSTVTAPILFSRETAPVGGSYRLSEECS